MEFACPKTIKTKMMLQAELHDGIAQLGIEVTKEAQIKLLNYLTLLQKWNKVYNLTAIRDPRQMVSNHLLDSLAVVPYLWPSRWLDVGSGAGLPGIVLAIVNPDFAFTLVDSNRKKTSFIQQASIELGLKNVEVRCERIETWENNEKYDGIISRAFAETTEFVTVTRHLLKIGGRWAAMKGAPEEELKHLPEDVKLEKIISLQVPKLNAARSLVVIRENK
jgi:16S rRNA (guanine527-N7)-methyltransferase